MIYEAPIPDPFSDLYFPSPSSFAQLVLHKALWRKKQHVSPLFAALLWKHFLLKLMFCCTCNTFKKGSRQGCHLVVTVGRPSTWLELFVVSNLGEASSPFVTSQRPDFQMWLFQYSISMRVISKMICGDLGWQVGATLSIGKAPLMASQHDFLKSMCSASREIHSTACCLFVYLSPAKPLLLSHLTVSFSFFLFF